eukprot:SAG31_NODE_700_length_12734_cov_212.705105_5_plen_151_part_00
MFNRNLEARKRNERAKSLETSRSRKRLLPAPGPELKTDGEVALRPVEQPKTLRPSVHDQEYLANGTFRTIQKKTPTPAYLSSTTVFCGTIMCHHRKPHKEIGDYRVTSLRYEPEYRRVAKAVHESSRGLLTVVRLYVCSFLPLREHVPYE